jgi:hypothetical protein
VEKVLRQAVALRELVLLQGVPRQEQEALPQLEVEGSQQLVQEQLVLAQVEPQVEVEVLAEAEVLAVVVAEE